MSEATALIRAAKAYEAIPDFSHFLLLHFAAFMVWHRWRNQTVAAALAPPGATDGS